MKALCELKILYKLFTVFIANKSCLWGAIKTLGRNKISPFNSSIMLHIFLLFYKKPSFNWG